MSGRRPRATAPKPFIAPVVPPRQKTPEEEAQSRQILQRLEELHRLAVQNNLRAAVALAQQAFAGHGPLVDFFADLGRDYGHLLEQKSKAVRSASRFDVIEGGAA